MYAAANRHLRGEKSTSRKKATKSACGFSRYEVAIAAAVLVTFIGGLYFITHHKKEESETLQPESDRKRTTTKTRRTLALHQRAGKSPAGVRAPANLLPVVK